MWERIKNLRKTEKGRTLLRFIKYMTFFLIVLFSVIIINGFNGYTKSKKVPINIKTTDTQNTNTTTLTYLEKQEKIYNGPYSFTYNISGELNLVYEGTYSNGITEGYKNSNSEVIKYKIENDEVYEIKLNEQIPYDNLYIGLDANLFDFHQIFDKLNASSTLISKTEEGKSYTYKLDDYEYIIYLNDKEIYKIEITNNDLTYEYLFTY